jgi:hypothetical protein
MHHNAAPISSRMPSAKTTRRAQVNATVLIAKPSQSDRHAAA